MRPSGEKSWQEKRADDFGRIERAALEVAGGNDEWDLPRKLRFKMFLFRLIAPLRDWAVVALRNCGLISAPPVVPLGVSLSTDPSTTSPSTTSTAPRTKRLVRLRDVLRAPRKS